MSCVEINAKVDDIEPEVSTIKKSIFVFKIFISLKDDDNFALFAFFFFFVTYFKSLNNRNGTLYV